jgi:uncharacterized LabA/DUF88 family protein
MSFKEVMALKPNERIAMLIDGSNTYAAVKNIDVGFDIDYQKLKDWFTRRGNVVRMLYFTAIWRDENGHENIRPLVDWLSTHGYRVHSKPATSYVNDGEKIIKGNMDVELVIHALRQARVVDHLYLFTGDGDFKPLVEELQDQGKTVTIVSTISTRPQMCADVLRKQCDHFIDLVELRTQIAKEKRLLPS